MTEQKQLHEFKFTVTVSGTDPERLLNLLTDLMEGETDINEDGMTLTVHSTGVYTVEPQHQHLKETDNDETE